MCKEHVADVMDLRSAVHMYHLTKALAIFCDDDDTNAQISEFLAASD